MTTSDVSRLIGFIAFGGVAAYIFSSLFRDWLRKRRITASLATRPQRDDEQFGRSFFPDAKQSGIASRVRRVLSKNLKMPLDGLNPSDRLDEDLNAELPANPHLFWELEEEFGIKASVEDLESFQKTAERLVTFQDLVEFVAAKTAESPKAAADAGESDKSSPAYALAIRSIPVLCFGGFLTVILGIAVNKKALINLGVLLFLSGIAMWGLANAGETLRMLVRSRRGSKWKDAPAWSLILSLCLALVFLWFGGALFWAILKSALSLR